MDWFRHDYFASTDIKIRKLLRNYGECAYGAYWLIVELLYQQGGSASAEEIADTFELMSSPGMKEILANSGLFQISDNGTWSSNRVYEEIQYLNESRRKKSDAGKKGMASRWGNRDNNVITDDNTVITKPNTPITPDNTIPNLTLPSNIPLSVSKETSSPKGKSMSPSTSNFRKPTLEEVKAYCKERNNQVNAEDFIDYYESVGWIVGKGKRMKDWKASIRTWEKDKSSPKTERNNFYGGKFIKGTDIHMDLTAKGADRTQYDPNVRLEDVL